MKRNAPDQNPTSSPSSVRPPKGRRLSLRTMGSAAVVLLVVVAVVFAVFRFLDPGVVRGLTIEAGSSLPPAERFLTNSRHSVRYASDPSAVDVATPGMYALEIRIDDRPFEVVLTVADTTPPTGDSVDVQTFRGKPVAPAAFVPNASDVTAVTFAYRTQPDFDRLGEQTVTVVMSDTSGNQAELSATLTVVSDTEAPAIAFDADLTVYIGQPIAYREGVVVTDNCDADVVLEIDNADVNLFALGTYTVVYSATDRAGNRAEIARTVVVTAKPVDFVTLDDLNRLVDQVFSEILKPGMSDLERLSEIFYYIADRIDYVGTSDKNDWVQAAYLGITRGTGDCFNYYALARAMLIRAGFESIPLERVPEAKTRHYWHLVKFNGEWYHYDPTPYLPKRQYVCLLRTEAEIVLYSSYEPHFYYIYDHDGKPPAATTTLNIPRRIIHSG